MTNITPRSHVWVHGEVTVRPSPIAGNGLFATADLAVGTVVIRLGGRLVSSAHLTALIAASSAEPDAPYVDTITVDEDLHLVLPPSTMVHFGNHSCDPTLWHVGPYEIAARRAIGAGEELTVDYGTQSGAGGFSMRCSCRSPLCRGAVSSDDWRRPELQNRYRGHWVPALENRISAS